MAALLLLKSNPDISDLFRYFSGAGMLNKPWRVPAVNERNEIAVTDNCNNGIFRYLVVMEFT